MASFRHPRYTPLDLMILLLVAVASSTGVTWFVLTQKYRDMIGEAVISPLLHVILAKSAADPRDPNDERYSFSQDWVTRNVPVWNKALERFKGEPNITYLEIGAFEGRSVLWMLQNILTHPSARVTAIDIFAGPCKEAYFGNIERSGLGHKVTTIAEASQTALRRLPAGSFDFIYVDGSHRKADVLQDAVLSWPLLKKSGLMIFDDYGFVRVSDANRVCPKVAVDAFVQCFENECEVIHNERQLIIRKTGRKSS